MPGEGVATLLIQNYMRFYSAVFGRLFFKLQQMIICSELAARNGLTLNDIDLWEIHECNVAAIESETFLREKANMNNPLGKFPWGRLSPNGDCEYLCGWRVGDGGVVGKHVRSA
jgi:hypothetical protein